MASLSISCSMRFRSNTISKTWLLLLGLVLLLLKPSAGRQATFSADHDSIPFPSLESTAFPVDAPEPRNFLSATLGSNMVLQRDKPAMMWGFGTPFATITTVLQKSHTPSNPPLSSMVDATGVWRQVLPVQKASKIPFSITITASTGESARLDNVLFGDVFVCGGQSNMVFSVAGTTNGTREAMMGNNYPHIRVFTVGQATSSPDKPLGDLQTVEQPWQVANELSLMDTGMGAFGTFSSVCWFFGQTVADGLNNEVPIGLISSNWGGTRVEAWQAGTYWNARANGIICELHTLLHFYNTYHIPLL